MKSLIDLPSSRKFHQAVSSFLLCLWSITDSIAPCTLSLIRSPPAAFFLVVRFSASLCITVLSFLCLFCSGNQESSRSDCSATMNQSDPTSAVFSQALFDALAPSVQSCDQAINSVFASQAALSEHLRELEAILNRYQSQSVHPPSLVCVVLSDLCLSRYCVFLFSDRYLMHRNCMTLREWFIKSIRLLQE